MPALISIGELARRAGVSVQTLRHYHQLGLLRPARSTAAGYRLYDDEQRARLDLIRALRELDFDLATIGRLLRGAADVRDAAELQLRALDLQLRVLERRRAVLRVLLRSAKVDSERLARLQLLTGFERAERERFLSEELTRRLGAEASTSLGAMIIRGASVDLPDDPSADQVEAWLELAELVADPSFLTSVRDTAQPRTKRSRASLEASMRLVFKPAAAAALGRIDPASPRARRLVERWVSTHLQKTRVTVDDVVRFRQSYEAGRDAKAERFWELVAVLRPDVKRSPISIGLPFLVEALRAYGD